MKTKIELIDRAYSKLRISGLTVNPNPNEVVLALDELECMMAEWDLKNICLNFQFEDDPSPNAESGLSRGYENAVQTNLAVRLSPDYGKAISVELKQQASQSYSVVSSATAKIKAAPYPNRQPVGESNTLRFNRWRRYYDINPEAPNECQTEIMSNGDVVDGKVDYSDYLTDGDTIASMNISSTSGLDIQYSEFDDESVGYRVQATKDGTQSITVNITTSNGLSTKTCIWYSVVRCK